MKFLSPGKLRVFIVLGVIAILIVTGFSTDKFKKAEKRISKTAHRQWLILKGELVDIGGYRLHIVCQGKGSPTILMDAGLNMTMESWGIIPRETAKFTRVCIYERAGLGESDKIEMPRTSRQIVAELHALLQNADEKEPFILVGHSFGGINMRLYASLYPQAIAGLVLIDSSHEDEYARYAALKSPAERKNYLEHEAGGNFEGVNLLASSDEIRSAPPIPVVPLYVLSAERETNQEQLPMIKAHDEMQLELARLVPDSKFIKVQNTSHFIQLDQPETVIYAIRSIYDLIQNSNLKAMK